MTARERLIQLDKELENPLFYVKSGFRDRIKKSMAYGIGNEMSLLFGIKVPNSVYEEYNNRNYLEFVPSNPWGNTKFTLHELIYWSDSILDDNLARDCRKALMQLKREVIEKYADDEREVFKGMMHEKFEDYLRDLTAIYERGAGERRKLLEEAEKDDAKWHEYEKANLGNEYALIIGKADCLRAKDSRKHILEELQERTRLEVSAVRQEMEKHVTMFYTPSGKMIDEDAVKLLNSGIVLTEEEINGLVAQHQYNPTMLRLLDDYCSKNEINNSASKVYATHAKKAGQVVMQIFDNVSEVLLKAVGDDKGYAKTWSNPERFGTILENAIASVDGVKVKPMTIEGETTD